jgi:HPt (histidine-containing phosphotransfer) domain-containing protein
VPKQLSGMRDSLDNKQQEVLIRQAHTLKGASANMEAVAIRFAAYELEASARAGDYEKAEAEYFRCKVEFERFCNNLIAQSGRSTDDDNGENAD